VSGEAAEAEAEPAEAEAEPKPVEAEASVAEPEVAGRPIAEPEEAGAEELEEPEAVAEDEEPEDEPELAGTYERPARVLTPRVAEPPPPEPAPAPPAAAREHVRRPIGVLVLIALLAAAAVGGYLVGHTRPRSQTVSFTNSAAVNHLQLRYPSTWQLSASATVVPGMRFDAPLVLSHGGRGRLTAGTDASAAGRTLLARSFRARVVGGLPHPATVRLGGIVAYRYTGVRVRGLSTPVSVYAAPTSAGVATIACWDPTGTDRTFQGDCTRIAATLRLIGARAYPLGPSPGYARLVSNIFGRLRASTRGPLATLAGTRSASTQAGAARQLAGAYGTAADALDGATAPPMARDAQSAVVAALRRCASAYGAAAAAAKTGAAIPPINATSLNAARAAAEAAYRRAGGALGAASAALSQALRGLSSLGYTLSGQR
jgi:hypothetical protein